MTLKKASKIHHPNQKEWGGESNSLTHELFDVPPQRFLLIGI